MCSVKCGGLGQNVVGGNVLLSLPFGVYIHLMWIWMCVYVCLHVCWLEGRNFVTLFLLSLPLSSFSRPSLRQAEDTPVFFLFLLPPLSMIYLSISPTVETFFLCLFLSLFFFCLRFRCEEAARKLRRPSKARVLLLTNISRFLSLLFFSSGGVIFSRYHYYYYHYYHYYIPAHNRRRRRSGEGIVSEGEKKKLLPSLFCFSFIWDTRREFLSTEDALWKRKENNEKKEGKKTADKEKKKER